jgi:uncharacterized membrane protein YhaH (DUF805 family)
MKNKKNPFADFLIRTFQFRGRSTKQQFWPVIIPFILLEIFMIFSPLFLSETAFMFLWFAYLIINLLALIPLFSLTSRRFHDAGFSGKLLLVLILVTALANFLVAGWLVRIVFQLFILFICFKPSKYGSNQNGKWWQHHDLKF